MGKLLLNRGYATGIFAFNNIFELSGKLDFFLLDEDAVLDDVDCNAGINVAEDIEIDVKVGVNFDDILFAKLAAHNVFDDCNRAVQLVKLKEIIDLHTLAGLDMVDNDTVFYRIYVHTSTSKSLRMRAIRIYFPLSACLK